MRVCQLLSGTCCRYQHVSLIRTNEQAGRKCLGRGISKKTASGSYGFNGRGIENLSFRRALINDLNGLCQGFYTLSETSGLFAVVYFFQALDLYNTYIQNGGILLVLVIHSTLKGLKVFVPD